MQVQYFTQMYLGTKTPIFIPFSFRGSVALKLLLPTFPPKSQIMSHNVGKVPEQWQDNVKSLNCSQSYIQCSVTNNTDSIIQSILFLLT